MVEIVVLDEMLVDWDSIVVDEYENRELEVIRISVQDAAVGLWIGGPVRR